MRIARVTPPGLVHHVISRFIDKDWLITADDEREHYLWLLGRALVKTDWTCLAYAIMSSHIHLALVAGDVPSERWSRRVHAPFANWLNERHGRIGPVFASRATMWMERTERVGSLVAYIHNNPVRAGVVERAAQSTWTSHRAYAGLAPRPSWLEVETGLRLAGASASSFDAWVDGVRGVVLEPPQLAGIHRAARTLGALELAAPTREPLETALVARPFAWIRPNPARVVDVAADVTGVGLPAIRSRSHGEAAVARAIAITTGREFGLSFSAMASALGISAQAASRLASRELDASALAMVRVTRDRIARDKEVRLIKEKASPGKLAE